jgi:ABC-type multidrug transport system fused ATPase/permease subunit
MISTGMGPRRALSGFGTSGKGPAFKPKVARRLLAFLRPHRGKMGIALGGMLLATGAELLSPYLMKVAIDEHIAAGDLPGLARTALFLAGTFVALYGATVLQRYLLSWAGQRVLFALRERLFRHLQRLHLGYFDRSKTGVTVSRIINDVGVINELLTQGVVTIVGDLALLVGIVAVMMSMSSPLALLTFAVLPLMVVATYFFSRMAKRAFSRTRKSVADVVGSLAEDISGIQVIQAFGQEERSRAQFDEKNRKNREAHVQAMTVSFIFLPTVELIATGATAIVLWFGGQLVVQDLVTLGVLVAFLSYVTQFFRPIRELSQVYTTMQSAMAAGEHIFQLLDTEPEIQDPEVPQEPEHLRGAIEFRDVRLSYVEGVEVLHGISFRAEPGELVALVGPTGAGKSSIANLLCRFYDVTDGAVLVDGVDVRAMSQSSLRSRMAIVTQDPFLFSGTIEENLRFGRPEATEAELVDAAKRAHVHAFIMSLPDGYRSEITEGAANLSVGQRQLLSIARAIVQKPQILILDEATANIDTVTEVVIQRALEELFRSSTSLVIAHRLSTIRRASQILHIDQGRITERGTHADLLAAGGSYAAMHATQ